MFCRVYRLGFTPFDCPFFLIIRKFKLYGEAKSLSVLFQSCYQIAISYNFRYFESEAKTLTITFETDSFINTA